MAKSQITEATPPPARAETAGIQIRRRFPWGEVTFQLALQDGRVQEAQVYSDAMDADFIQALGPCLTGAPYQPQALAAAVSQLPGPLAQDLAQWLQTQAL